MVSATPEVRLLELRATDFEPAIWYASVSILRSGSKGWLEVYARKLLSLLDLTIYGLNRIASDSEEVASDPYLYQTLGFVLTSFTRHRRMLLNYIEGLTGSRPKLNKDALEAYRNLIELSSGWADFIAGCKLALRLLITAARAGIFYANDRNLRIVLTALIERDYEYNTYIDEFLGRYAPEPDAFEPSAAVASTVLSLAMNHFPQEPVTEAPPKRWVEVCREDEVPTPIGTKLVVVDGWLELLIVRSGTEFYAVENVCTHEGGWLSDGLLYPPHMISCIDHLAKFDVRTGEVLTQPHHGLARPLATFPVKVEGGKVLVGLHFT
jgi:3-phenylpropionate/trans-cinnamate dioxygenase ferredoxin subunit